MTDRLPGKYQSTLHTKPWFFSGKVPEIKYSYTVSGLTPSSYPIRPRSIIPGSKLGIHQFPLVSLNSDESKEQDFKRQFREYNFLKDQEILITIEHCDNCEDHLSSTRHDPAKYHNLAQLLKNSILSRYSIIKILIKPLSKQEPEINKRRLGAFEIQLATKIRGILNVQVIHSKLLTRKWPEITEVMLKISKFLPNFKLNVVVYDELSQDQGLSGIKVVLRPKAVELDQIKTSIDGSTFRPRSAVTARSCKSIRAMSSRRLSRKELMPKKSKVFYERTTDKDGNCVFDGITLDHYEVSIEDSRDYKGTARVLNAFDEKLQSGQINMFIGLNSFGNCNLKVLLKDGVLRTEVTQARISLRNDGIEYVLHESKKGVYEISVPKAEYWLSVESDKYKELKKKLVALDSEMQITESLELKKNKEVSVSVYDAITGSSLSGVILELLVNNSLSLSGMTKSGKFIFKVQETGTFYLKSQIKGYIHSKLYIQVETEIHQINVPLMPFDLESPAILVSLPSFLDNLEVIGQTDSAELSSNRPEIEGYKMLDKLKTHGYLLIFLDGGQKNLRISIRALSKELVSANGFVLSGLCVQYYSYTKLISVIKPSYGYGEWWDLGIYSTKHNDFIETNLISNYKLPVAEFFSDILAIIKYLSIVESVSSAFGFPNPKQDPSSKDTLIPLDRFKNSVKNFISEGFIPWFLESVKTNDSISLNSLVNRFSRYAGIGMNPFKTFNSFLENFELNETEKNEYESELKEGFFFSLPIEWEVGWNKKGKIVYLNSAGQQSKEFPGVALSKNKILELKKQEIKKKNMDLDKSVNKRPEKEKSFSSKSSKSSKKSQIDKESERYQEEFSQVYKSSIEIIEFYKNHKEINQDLYKVTLEKVETGIKTCENHLNSRSSTAVNEFFSFWVQKLVEVHNMLKSIELEINATHTLKPIEPETKPREESVHHSKSSRKSSRKSIRKSSRKSSSSSSSSSSSKSSSSSEYLEFKD